jgi:hypothetical protein
MGSHDRDRFDDLLEGALKRYAAVEPRAGIEGRVLENLAAQRERRLIGWRWMWALSSIGALVVALALWPSHSSSGIAPDQRPGREGSATIVPPAPKTVQSVSAKPRQVRRAPRALKAVLEAEAKLPRFPSPRPIGEQELLLVEYVQRYPDEAILIAKQQGQFQAAVEQAEREIRENSNQQGR